MTGLEVLDQALLSLLHNDQGHYTHEVGFVHELLRGMLDEEIDVTYLYRNISSLERSGGDAAKQSEG